MIKRFIKDGLIYTFVTLFSRGISFLLIPVYTRTFVPEEYGVIDMLTLLGIILNLSVSLEISQGIARYIPGIQNQVAKSKYLSSGLWFSIIMYIATCSILFSFSGFGSSLLLNSSKWQQIFRVATVAIGVNGIFIYLNNAFRHQLKVKQSGIVGIIYAGLSFLLIILFIKYFKLGLTGIYLGITVSASVGILISFLLGKNQYKLYFSLVKVKRLLRFSLPLVPSSIGFFVATYVDRLVIKEYMSMSDVGIYGIAVKFASIIGLLISGFNSALTPLIYKKHQEKETPRQVGYLMSLYLFFSFLLISILSFFSKEILILVTTDSYYGASQYIGVLALSAVTTSAYMFLPGLGIAKKTKLIAAINISIGVVNLILNILTIPKYGLSGAVISTFTSSMLGFVLNIQLSNKYYPIQIKKTKLFFFYLLGGASLLMASFLEKNVEALSFLIKSLAIILMTLVAFVIIFTKEQRKMTFSRIYDIVY